MKNKKIKTRIAPSPTGLFHIGTARTALFNYIYAKQNGGEFILRIEDTDFERSEKKFEKDIFESLDWLGLKPDCVYRQSERSGIYKKYIEKLIEDEFAYKSIEPSKNNPNEEVEVIRFKNTFGEIKFIDTVRGEIKNDISELGDFVIAKGIDKPLYNLAVVIDDIEMGITNVIRGDDHITNTARQIVLFKSLNAEIPVYTHISLIHSSEGGKLSKRHGATSITEFRELGFLSESLVNYMALLGVKGKDDAEIFLLGDLLKIFSLNDIQPKEAVFDMKKLMFLNKHYLQKKSLGYVRKNIIKSLVERFGFFVIFKIKKINMISQLIREKGGIFSEERSLIKEDIFSFKLRLVINGPNQ